MVSLSPCISSSCVDIFSLSYSPSSRHQPPPTPSSIPCKTNRTMDPRYFSDVAALFGAFPEDTILDIGGCGRVDASVYNKHVQVRQLLLTSGMQQFGWPISNGLIIFWAWQVFESSKFEVLAAAVKTSLQQGKAVVVTMKLDVLANKAQGIQGGYTADCQSPNPRPKTGPNPNVF